MSPYSTFHLGTILIALHAGSNAGAQVCEIEHTRGTGLVQNPTTTPRDLFFPPFDPTRGQLLGVSIEIFAPVAATFFCHSTCGSFQTFRVSLCGQQVVKAPGFSNTTWFYICKQLVPPNNTDFSQSLGSETIDLDPIHVSGNPPPGYSGPGDVKVTVQILAGDSAEQTSDACSRPNFSFQQCPNTSTPICMNKRTDFTWNPTVTLRYQYRTACHGDMNCDGLVNDTDFGSFAIAYNILVCTDAAMPSGCPADFNRDGVVDDADFVLFIASYNRLTCT